MNFIYSLKLLPRGENGLEYVTKKPPSRFPGTAASFTVSLVAKNQELKPHWDKSTGYFWL
ncbi:hypothetical protein [Caproicibacter fermentans]|uniref:hypothetical protein n=1 Tax=Caproicibacter fermentans TaxID=2576756 RepID=UPI0012EE8C39|nr:hypothetical protein [Caproicibacter fermentans]